MPHTRSKEIRRSRLARDVLFVPPMTGTYSRLVVALALGLASTACLTFEQQSISYIHDTAGDRLLVYAQYTGIYGDGRFQTDVAEPGQLTAADKDALIAAYHGQKFYLFDNFVRVLDVNEMKRLLAEPAPPLPRELDRAVEAARRAFWQKLAVNVSISNGPFYIDRQGRLCAVQRMTVTNLAATVQAFNDSWRLYGATLFETHPEWSYRAASIDATMIFTGNELTLRYPGPATDVEASLAGMVRVIEDQDGLVEVTFGRPDAGRVVVSSRLATDYAPNAVEFVRHRIGIAAAFDPVADANRFFSGAKR